MRILNERMDIDLVLLDYLLPPGIDGLEVLRRMKALGHKTPVILVTGHGSEEVAVKAFRQGVKNYIITNPFKTKELQTIVRETLAPISHEKSPVDKAIDSMEREYCRPISAREVARGIGISYDYLAHLFQNNKGCTIMQWLNKVRIEEARTYLWTATLRSKWFPPG